MLLARTPPPLSRFRCVSSSSSPRAGSTCAQLSEDGQSFLHRGETKRLQPAKVAKKVGAEAEGALIEKVFGVLKHVGWTDLVDPPDLHLLPSQGGMDENDILVKHQNLHEVVERLRQQEEG